MTKYKAPIKPKQGSRPIVNYAGGAAFDRDPRMSLASIVCTSMGAGTFYKDEATELDELKALVPQVGVEFAAKAALYARHQGKLRSISHALAGEVARHCQGQPWGRRFFEKIVFRLDDAAQIASYYIGQYCTDPKGRKTLPSAMKRGFAKVLENSTEENLARWFGSGNKGAMTLRQLAHLVHPKGPEGSAVYKLRAGQIAQTSSDSWEAALSAGADQQEAWHDLLSRGRLKYLAALRNCRNIIATGRADTVTLLCSVLTSQEDIQGSKVLPFQIVTAHDIVSGLTGPLARQVLGALEIAADRSLSNCPELPGSTLVALDVSGSMKDPPHFPIKHAAMLAAAIARRNADCDLILFDTSARSVQFSQSAPLMQIVKELRTLATGGGTNFSLIFRAAQRAYDRIIVLSDQQSWVEGGNPAAYRNEYEMRTACLPKIVSWDLQGTTSSQFRKLNGRLNELTGFSDAALDVLKALEEDPMAMVKAIEEIVL